MFKCTFVQQRQCLLVHETLPCVLENSSMSYSALFLGKTSFQQSTGPVCPEFTSIGGLFLIMGIPVSHESKVWFPFCSRGFTSKTRALTR